MSSNGSRLAIAACGAAMLVLAGCGGGTSVRESLGIAKRPPDEFSVVSKSPLALPPDFSLRPPAPGSARPQDADTASRASVALFGPSVAGGVQDGAPVGTGIAGAPSESERQILALAGADRVNPNIRAVLNEEQGALIETSTPLAQEILGIQPVDRTGITVDPQKEAERLRKNKEQGLPVTNGETPLSTPPRQQAPLEGVF